MLHIVNGDTVAEKLKGNVPGDVLVWREIYSDGPVFIDLREERCRMLRSRYLERTMGIPSSDYMRFCEEQERELSRCGQHEEIVLWFEHDLFDQTMLCYLLHRFARLPLERTRLSLLCIGAFPGLMPFRGLGELSPDQLSALIGSREPVGRGVLALGSAIWEAYASPDPSLLLERLQGDTAALPYVREAFRLHLSRFPSTRNGLGIVEQTTLERVSDGASDPLKLFAAVSGQLPGLGMGDLSYWHCLARMSQGTHPLLRLEGLRRFPDYREPEPSFRHCAIGLTETGRRVLSGEADWVELNGIDEWYGGVHLQGHAAAWRWNPSEGKLA